ncbi:MAG: hypothetical protein JSV88_21330 [Candidatus Aminicenantes bacterium]|nr:MAG: hypothetical protein JSV88_21330 [Candidatus Aminicenantes bacterium]
MVISRKKLSIILVCAFIFIISGTGAGSPCFASNFKMVKHLSVAMEESYPDSIMSWGGTVDIDGTLKGSIILLGGRLELDGIVEEDIICVSSKIRMGEHARVKGELFVIGGILNRHPQSTVNGEYFNIKFDLKKIENTLIPILSDSRTLAFFKVMKIILWFIISLIVFAVVPKQINHAQEIFETNILKMGALGILSVFTFLFLLFAFFMMSLIIIGIPLLLLLVLLSIVIFIFGRTVIFYLIGIKLSKLLKLKNINPALFIVMGVVVYSILKFIPFVGPLILILMNLFEVGISVGFLLRKKLKLQA